MPETIQLGDIVIAMTRKDIKHVHLSVHPPEGRVTLVAPKGTRLEVARAYATSKLGWIRSQQAKLQGQARETPRAFIERESHYLWGRRHLLSIAAQIRHALGKAAEACVELEREVSLDGTIRFRTNEVLLRVTDRLAAPDDDTLYRLKQDVAATFATLYAEAPLRLERDDQQSLFAIRVSTTEPPPLRTLSDRIRDIPGFPP